MPPSSQSNRLIWVVRHGEREDNVNPNWRQNGALPRGQWDDPPLSARGLVQAAEVGQHLSNESASQIQFILCSPFTRCLQTAEQILAKLAQKGQFPKMLIEPGFCESLNACQNPPGFPKMDQIRQNFPNLPILPTYNSFFRPENLPKNECTNFCCFRRVIGTLKYALEELNGNLAVVSHGSPICAIHFAMTGQLDYMGQCTISKYRLKQGGIGCQKHSSFLPLPSKSIRILALPSNGDRWKKRENMVELEGNGGGEERRRNSMPTGTGKFTWKKAERKDGEGELDGHLTICLAQLMEAATERAELGLAVDCLAAGDSGHLSDKRNLHDLLRL